MSSPSNIVKRLLTSRCRSGLAANMTGISGAKSFKFSTKLDAVKHFISALESGLVEQCIYDINRTPVTSVVDTMDV